MKAYAIVQKKKPKISLLDIYSTKQIKTIKLGKGEQIIKILITAVTVKKPKRTKK